MDTMAPASHSDSRNREASQVADAELESWLAEIAAAPRAAPSVTNLRAKRTRPLGPEIAMVDDHFVSSGDAHPVSVRSYRHDGVLGVPTCVYVHGGGFVFGDLDSHDRACRRLAVLGGINVIAVDYRRAPENPAPAAIDDVRTVLTATRTAIGAHAPLGLAGDSAGALIALLATDAPRAEVDRVLLVNPNADLTLSMPSVKTKGTGWGLDAQDLEWFVSQWAPTPELRESRALNPLLQLPPATPMTTVITSEHDPLRDEGLALAEHLRDAGRLTKHRHLDGMVHGVINLDAVSPSARAWGDQFLTEFARELIDARR